MGKHECEYPRCERRGLGCDIGNDGKPISCPRRYHDGAICLSLEQLKENDHDGLS